MADHFWAVGWYWKRKPRHAVPMTQTIPMVSGTGTPALCRSWVYPLGFQNRSTLHVVPVADTPEVMARPACKHCERRLSKA